MEKSFSFITPFIHWIQKEDKYVGKVKSVLNTLYFISAKHTLCALIYIIQGFLRNANASAKVSFYNPFNCSSDTFCHEIRNLTLPFVVS